MVWSLVRTALVASLLGLAGGAAIGHLSGTARACSCPPYSGSWELELAGVEGAGDVAAETSHWEAPVHIDSESNTTIYTSKLELSGRLLE